MPEDRGLDRYREMRDFDVTNEPRGDEPESMAARRRFVIQQHDATRLHWDLRLEDKGVLVSWAMPRGLPWTPKENHLAVHTEDHPLEYLDFHGDIPSGEYGAGHMTVWDTGTYDIEEWTERKAVVVFHGGKANGRYSLFATRGRDWIIHRMDPPEDPNRQPLPGSQPIVVAPRGDLPARDGEWAFEVCWRGRRVLVTSSGGVATISDANGADVSRWFPEVRRIGRAIGITEVILDGIVVDPAATTDDPSNRIERRLAAKSDSTIRNQSRDHPLSFIAFDVVWVDGYSLASRPWHQRRAALDELVLAGPAWTAPAAHIGDGEAMLAAARAQGLSGLVAKRVDAPYDPNASSPVWVRVDV